MKPTENVIFESIEGKWMPFIIPFIENHYQGVHLPSHDISHHLRVWAFCKQLIEELSRAGSMIAQPVVEAALVASLFHDTGLTIDRGERHGHISSEVCLKFLQEHSNLDLELSDEALYAIEHHDDKSFKGDASLNARVNLLAIVSAADDLDAFGYVGVFRYLEIYALRGLALQEIPRQVVVNLNNRFGNFKQQFGFCTHFTELQEQRYGVTLNFFERMIAEEDDGIENSAAFFGIAKCLLYELIDKKHDIKTTLTNSIISNLSVNAIEYFMGLKEELY